MFPRCPLTTGRTAGLCCTCAAVVTMSGCAMMMNIRPAADSYTYDLGTASAQDARAKAEAALVPLGYRFPPGDGLPGVEIQSQWQSRAPIDEQERASGYEIISRVKVNGRLTEVAGAPKTYRVLLTVENRFVPSRGTSRTSRQLGSPAGSTYARSIVKQMGLVFGGTTRPVADEPRPF
jgi:hypothetical protein